MTPQEALQILDGASSQTKASRADHIMIQQAVEVLRGTIKTEELINTNPEERP